MGLFASPVSKNPRIFSCTVVQSFKMPILSKKNVPSNTLVLLKLLSGIKRDLINIVNIVYLQPLLSPWMILWTDGSHYDYKPMMVISGLLILRDGAISHNRPQIASDRTIHEKSHNSQKITHYSQNQP